MRGRKIWPYVLFLMCASVGTGLLLRGKGPVSVVAEMVADFQPLCPKQDLTTQEGREACVKKAQKPDECLPKCPVYPVGSTEAGEIIRRLSLEMRWFVRSWAQCKDQLGECLLCPTPQEECRDDGLLLGWTWSS